MSVKYEVYEGSITDLDVEAIVNAANNSLLGGGGVDGAIHRVAGPELKKFCMGLHGCDTGDAKITPGFNLKALHVIHTVGPVWRGGGAGEPELLKSCYQRSLELVEKFGLKSIAFPSISTGAYKYPLDKAAEIAISVCHSQGGNLPTLERVIFACFGVESASLYRRLLNN